MLYLVSSLPNAMAKVETRGLNGNAVGTLVTVKYKWKRTTLLCERFARVTLRLVRNKYKVVTVGTT